jgi:DNA-binding beta-propeller fold protein YncE
MFKRLVAITFLTALFVNSTKADTAQILGKKPAHISSPSSVPNEQAITKMIWAPGIDDGYVPQGLAFADGAVFISGYQSTDPKVDKGPCRVFKVATETGQQVGFFDLLEDCGHAGGLVSLGNGVLIIADTRRLYKVDLPKALQSQNAESALLGSVRLSGQLKGSFIDFDGSSIFIGSSEKDQSKAKGHYLPLDIFDTQNGKTINEGKAIHSVPIGAEAQGAGFDRDRNLWLTFSSSKYGSLQKIDSKTGQVLADYRMAIGVEDIGFDDEGRLWIVSEAGSRRWSKWSQKFPILFQIDVTKLK